MMEVVDLTNDEIEVNEKSGWQKFWESQVAMPVVFITGAVAAVLGGVIGGVAGSAWAKKAAAELAEEDLVEAEAEEVEEATEVPKA